MRAALKKAEESKACQPPNCPSKDDDVLWEEYPDWVVQWGVWSEEVLKAGYVSDSILTDLFITALPKGWEARMSAAFRARPALLWTEIRSLLDEKFADTVSPMVLRARWKAVTLKGSTSLHLEDWWFQVQKAARGLNISPHEWLQFALQAVASRHPGLVTDRVNGLNLALMAAEGQGHPWSAEAVVRWTLQRLQREEKLDSQERSLGLTRRPSTGRQVSAVGGSPAASPRATGDACHNCGKVGHWAKECPMPPKPRAKSPVRFRPDACLNCGLSGHRAAECNNATLCWNCRKLGHHQGSCPEPRRQTSSRPATPTFRAVRPRSASTSRPPRRTPSRSPSRPPSRPSSGSSSPHRPGSNPKAQPRSSAPPG